MSRSSSRGLRTLLLRLETLEDRLVPTVDFASALHLGPPAEMIGNAEARDVVTDAAGNLYVTGGFSGTLDADPANVHADNADLLTVSSGFNSDAFVTKHATDGSFQWARRMGGDIAWKLAIDGTGNVFVAGKHANNADFGPFTTGASGTFVTKLDAAGNFLWLRSIPVDPAHTVASVAISSNGMLYVTRPFGPLAADFIIERLNPADGGVVWSTVPIGGNSYDSATGLATDAAGNVYVTGTFYGKVDFDPGPSTFIVTGGGRSVQYAQSTFVLKLTTAGTFGWAKSFNGSTFGSVRGSSIALDSAGAVYVLGSFDDKATFGSGKGSVSLTSLDGRLDAFVTNLDALGNTVWAKRLGGLVHDGASDLAVDANHVYVTGRFGDTADFNPASGIANLTSAGDSDVYLSILTRAGNYVWAGAMGGTGGDTGNAVAVGGTGNIYTAGGFSGTADFDPSATTYQLTDGGGFVAMFTQFSALRAAGVPAEKNASTSLTRQQADTLLAAVLTYWRRARVSPATLRGIDVQIADLPGDQLGRAVGKTIYLDVNAAGFGWFVDKTPGDSREFFGGRAVTAPAKGRMDALSVLAHEVGHVIGRGHDGHGVMAEVLTAGERKLPTARGITSTNHSNALVQLFSRW